MRLHSVEVHNWRQLNHKKIVFDEKSNLIYGPNEAGKSTILEALYRGIFDRTKSTATQIKGITPFTAMGRVSSTVKVSFSLNGLQYLIEKSFNHNKGSKLNRIENGTQTLIAQDDDADKILLEMIEADISSGASKPSTWGAFYWLWTPQENRNLPNKGDTTKHLHLDQKGSATLVTPLFQTVKELINSKYSEYFTAKGNSRKNSPLSLVRQDMQRQQSLLVDLNKKYYGVIESQNRVNELQKQIETLTDTIESRKEELEKSKEDVRALDSYERELKNIQMCIKETERNIKDAEDAIGQLFNISEKIDAIQKRENATIAEFSRLEALFDITKKQLIDITKKFEQTQSNVNKFEILTKDARIQYSIIGHKRQLEVLKEKLENISKIENEISKLQDKIKTVHITEAELERLLKRKIQIDALTNGLSEVGLRVKVFPGEKQSLDVNVDGVKLENALEATGTNEITVSSKDSGEVRISADIQKAKEIKDEIDSITSEIKTALQNNDVSSLDDLKELFTEQDKITAKIQELRKQRDFVDKRTVEDIKVSLKDHSKKIEEYSKTPRPELAVSLNSLDGNLGALIRQREKEYEETTIEFNLIKESRENKRQELEEIRAKKIEADTNSKNLQEKRMDLLKDQRTLIDKFGHKKSQEKIITDQKAILSSQKEKAEKILEEMKKLEGPLDKLRTLENKLENEEKILKQKTVQSNKLLGTIEKDSLDGVYSSISKEESKLEEIQERYERLLNDARSLELLKSLLEQEYQETLDSISKPIKKDVEEYLAYVTGNLHEEIELNDKLIPVRMGQKGIQQLALEYEDGSSGLKEAVNLCVRLAVAKHLSENDNQSLVLDDPFIHMSKNRSERMIELFNNLVSEQNLQIIIFTHRELEFTGLEGEMVNIQV